MLKPINVTMNAADQTIVAAPGAGYSWTLNSIQLTFSAPGTVSIKDGVGGNVLIGPFPVVAGTVIPFVFDDGAMLPLNSPLVINGTNAVVVGGVADMDMIAHG